MSISRGTLNSRGLRAAGRVEAAKGAEEEAGSEPGELRRERTQSKKRGRASKNIKTSQCLILLKACLEELTLTCRHTLASHQRAVILCSEAPCKSIPSLPVESAALYRSQLTQTSEANRLSPPSPIFLRKKKKRKEWTTYKLQT